MSATLFLLALGLAGVVASPPGTQSEPPTPYYEIGLDFGEGPNSVAESEAEIRTTFGAIGVDPKSTAFDQILDSSRLGKICRVYQKQNLRSVALRNLLRTICVVRREAITANAECLLGMETSMEPECERICARKFDISSNDGRCSYASCIVNCVDAQMRECSTESEGGELKKLYSEFVGSQMLLSWSAADEAEFNEKIGKMPLDCQKIAKIPVSLLSGSAQTSAPANSVEPPANTDGTLF